MREDAPIPVAEAVDQATDRAAELYDRLPSRPDLLCLCSYRYAGEQPFLTKEQLQQAGLPQPDEVTELPDPEEEGGFVRWLYWDLNGRRELIRPLLREIIRSDTAPDGQEWLTSSVYFCNQQLLYHLYDSRGADVAAVDREILQPLYENSREWILDYDRPAVDRLFEK